jgi:hypothetical protein
MNRPEGRGADSIGSFRQQLRVLERTGPTTVTPAFSMRSNDLGVFGARALPSVVTPHVAAARRRQTQKRRREVLYSLAAGVAGAVVLGFLPGLALMWWLSAVLFVALVGYVAVLAQLNLAAAQRTQRRAEYAMKVRHLPTPHSAAHPAYALQRSAN